MLASPFAVGDRDDGQRGALDVAVVEKQLARQMVRCRRFDQEQSVRAALGGSLTGTRPG